MRTHAGVFDVSHMGEIEVRGPGTTELLQRRLEEGGAQYSVGPVSS